MASENSSRPLLPQATQTQGYSFAPTVLAPREPQQRNYVFVDEHNRHKRLKVMRACEGCRRRKIKCDAATTNSWPCAACTRLKLNCVPPTVSYEKDSSTSPGVHTFEIQRVNDYPTIPIGNISDYHRQPPPQYAPVAQSMPPQVRSNYVEPMGAYQSPTYIDSTQPQLPYGGVPAVAIPESQIKYPQISYATPPPGIPSVSAPDSSWKSDGSVVSSMADELSEAMTELKIDHLGIAPYIAGNKKLAEAPAVEEIEINLPQTMSPDSRVRIPLEMMPSEEQALRYFDCFFNNIHPFVPVLQRQSFYHQWDTNRESISPLMLEAIFACSSLMLDEVQEGSKWLALAAKHEESFKDVPRLSTIQAMLLILKAREAAPKRGYFYRSWMTVVNMVAMAKDLDLHQHHEAHEAGQLCDNIWDCVAKTRIWQTLFILEAMIGGPQGRVDFGVDEDTVELQPPISLPGVDEDELQVSRHFVYFARVVKNIKSTIKVYARLRKSKKAWALDPDFAALDKQYPKWLIELPSDFQLLYPPQDQAVWVPSAFIGNVHCYHYLSTIMHHRPQIHYLTETDGFWRDHMLICYDAAKKMCRIQESMLQSYGTPGLMGMQRGISFTIYCVLTCTMLHLASITSPDPELNTDARDYFVRHMRILEKIAPMWPLPEMQSQIEALREAFSADINRPFELRASFPCGSPPPHDNASPLPDGAYRSQPSGQDMSLGPSQANYNMIHPITPPVSATDEDCKTDSPIVQSLNVMAQGAPAAVQSQDPYHGQWNPTRIFDQWTSAFGTPPSSTASQPSPPLRAPPAGNYDIRMTQGQAQLGQTAYSPQTGYSPHGTHMGLPANAPATTYAAPAPNFVSPTMWQDVVASSFGAGLNKRGWDYGGADTMEQMAKRQR
ncbi:hypothetical protein EJ06DRAFT_537972 [Trichodelitschia bisporula]|uniref:Zn(2)-C6 fungal-type domain-containing protein n=1 Tax=Trichodelitschia bisporula TaxID=703511 RepID=A0A6G1HWN6_9PEZI|nr:hypothetical protein EJ06DRAFT_537972 [Trichodelitschia bisporula]